MSMVALGSFGGASRSLEMLGVEKASLLGIESFGVSSKPPNTIFLLQRRRRRHPMDAASVDTTIVEGLVEPPPANTMELILLQGFSSNTEIESGRPFLSAVVVSTSFSDFFISMEDAADRCGRR